MSETGLWYVPVQNDYVGPLAPRSCGFSCLVLFVYAAGMDGQ